MFQVKGFLLHLLWQKLKEFLAHLSRMIDSPREILIKANEILQNTLNKKNFVSALYGIIDFENEVVRFARAGHCPALLVRGNSVETFKPSGIGLGLNQSKSVQ